MFANQYISTATTTTTTGPACLKCGTIKKSGKGSCCGRGGSWFKNCGSAGKKRLQHTWYEGIHACKTRTRSRIVIGLHEHAVQQKGIDPSHSDEDKENYKAFITSAKPFAFATANISTSMTMSDSVSAAYVTSSTNSKIIVEVVSAISPVSDNASTRMSTITSATNQGYEKSLISTLYTVDLLIIIVFTR